MQIRIRVRSVIWISLEYTFDVGFFPVAQKVKYMTLAIGHEFDSQGRHDLIKHKTLMQCESIAYKSDSAFSMNDGTGCMGDAKA